VARVHRGSYALKRGHRGIFFGAILYQNIIKTDRKGLGAGLLIFKLLVVFSCDTDANTLNIL